MLISALYPQLAKHDKLSAMPGKLLSIGSGRSLFTKRCCSLLEIVLRIVCSHIDQGVCNLPMQDEKIAKPGYYTVDAVMERSRNSGPVIDGTARSKPGRRRN